MYDGTEYVDIPPVWNYLQLPGTVIRQSGPEPNCDTVEQHSPFAFVGGVSTGGRGIGVSAQQLEGRGMSQLRAWFFMKSGGDVGSGVIAVSVNRTLTGERSCTLNAHGQSIEELFDQSICATQIMARCILYFRTR